MVQRVDLQTISELEGVLALKGTMPWFRWYELYLRTKWWRELREKVLERDGYACVRCKSKADVQVDHIRYSYGGEKLSDLQTLCYFCHQVKTKRYDLGAWKEFGKKKVIIDEGTQLFTVLR